MKTIKDIWYALIVDDKVRSVHPTYNQAEKADCPSPEIKVERVRVTIDRI